MASESELRARIVRGQMAMRERQDRALLVQLAGDDRRGIHQVTNRLHEWMDARYLELRVHGRPSADERRRPFLWRAWRDLPARGETALLLRGGADALVEAAAGGRIGGDELSRRAGAIVDFEEQVAHEGVQHVKVWLTVPPSVHARRKESEDAVERWWRKRVDSALFTDLAGGAPIAGEVRERTGHPLARWHAVDGSDKSARDLAVAEKIAEALEGAAAPEGEASPLLRAAVPDRLGALVQPEDLGEADYDARREALQREVGELGIAVLERGAAVVLVLQGFDAAGKGGAIRRVIPALDASFYRVIPVGAPDAEDRLHPYMWRFWRELPRAGRMTIFDRSWYGRVLVERVEGFATRPAWQRAYGEIRRFEAGLAAEGVVLKKLWLHVSDEEQLARFRARESEPEKLHKITADDWRNRGKRAEYVEAANEMVERTHAPHAPWVLIPADSKRAARLRVLEEVRDSLRDALRAAR